MKKKTLLGLVFLLGLFTLTACGSNTLSGDYTGKIKILFSVTNDTLRFKENTVIELDEDGKEINKGSYEIKDDQLKMKIGDSTMNATLSKDKKSFLVTSADGFADLASGTTYTKEEK